MIFAEDALVLLGRPLELYSPEAFFEFVNALYEPRTARGARKVLLPKGKFLVKPTKSAKRPHGIFQIRHATAMGELMAEVTFDRAMQLIAPSISELALSIQCEESLLKDFLKKKQFIIDSSVTTE